MPAANSILETHPVFEDWDQARALRSLARGVVYRPWESAHGARRWFVLWPAIPEPPVYVAVGCALVATEACAA